MFEIYAYGNNDSLYGIFNVSGKDGFTMVQLPDGTYHDGGAVVQ